MIESLGKEVEVEAEAEVVIVDTAAALRPAVALSCSKDVKLAHSPSAH